MGGKSGTEQLDIEVNEDRSAALWYSAEREADQGFADAINAAPSPDQNSAFVNINVLLFGLLSTVTDERSIALTLPATATPLDVLVALEDKFGSDAFSPIKDPVAGILPCCRLFVDGDLFEDVRAPISPEGKPSTIEMILLKGFEGG
ncbi:MAG: hypothetical protein CMM74_08695 [Rhodospirillaceae bacterium]|jgi:hypothetical protein|nr:hypothetical protein [Rhodospirillaceae bacterium]MDP6926749.1 hypothetical protein [Rhodospirillales bacterium]|tara:strand:- start:367 stop:807 length:441 start_codon:yes stop_codon:yes gene_type:complete